MMFHKLMYHVDDIKKKQPVSISIDITDKCNLNCSYCFVKDREQGELSFDKVKHVIDNLPSLKSVELGLGETLLSPYLDDIIDYLYKKKIAVGFCTNGILLDRIKKETLEKVNWVVIGITNYIDANNMKSFDWLPCSFSFICVYHYKSPYDIDRRLSNFLSINKKVKDVSLRSDITHKGDIIEIELQNMNLPENIRKIYASKKFSNWKGTCYYAHLKPLLLCDGNFYPCCVKTDGLNYSKKYKIAPWNEVDKYLNAEVRVNCEECSKFQYQEIIHNFFEDNDKEFIN